MTTKQLRKCPTTEQCQILARQLPSGSCPWLLSEHNKFLRMNLSDSKALCMYFPMVEGQGTMTKIPRHILGVDTDYRNVFRKIKDFRCMPEEAQKVEKKRWDSMRRWERELCNSRVKIVTQKRLEELQKAVRVARTPTTSRRTPADPAISDSQALHPDVASQMRPRRPLVPTTATNRALSLISPSAVMHQTNTTTPTAPSIAPAEHTTTATTAAAVPNDAPTEIVTAVAAAHDTPTVTTAFVGPADGSYVGMMSTHEDRENTARGLERRSWKRRKTGTNAVDVRQQSDCVAMDAEIKAMNSAAVAIDSMYYKSAGRNMPRHAMALLILNEVAETDKNGNRLRESEIKRDMPRMTIVTHSKQSIKAITKAYRDAFKHWECEDYERVVLLADNETGLVSTTVEAYTKARVETRQQPAKTSRPLSDTLASPSQQRGRDFSFIPD